MPVSQDGFDAIVTEAARAAGIDADGATLLRHGSNAMFLLPGSVVARVGRPGQRATAEREVVAARWLAGRGIAVTRALGELPQPIVIGDRPVTWWAALPPHRAGTPAELGAVLRAVHALPRPDFRLPAYDPFDGLDARIDAASVLSEDDRQWLAARTRRLRWEYEQLSVARAPRFIHGDAWQGNLAVIDRSPPVLLDLEKVSIGDIAWDLVQIAVDHTDFARVSAEEYRRFVDAYGGDDVTAWAGYDCCAAIQELRWIAFLLSKADEDPQTEPEIRHRIACVRGDVPKPWSWNAF